MEAALIASGLLMGVAGAPHCTAMCAAACTGIARRCAPGRPAEALAALHFGRLVSYAAGGAVVASSVGLLRTLADLAPALRPLWLLLHLAALALGAWLLLSGRQPRWMSRWGRPAAAVTPVHVHGRPARAALAGSLWVAWPCGLLQSALVVAALANGPLGGAGVMAAFAAGSSVGLVAGPALWWRLTGGGSALAAQAPAWSIRLAGGALAAAALFALGHGLWERIAAWCAA
jgi:sulfite exporter TauE/SafE